MGSERVNGVRFLILSLILVARLCLEIFYCTLILIFSKCVPKKLKRDQAKNLDFGLKNWHERAKNCYPDQGKVNPDLNKMLNFSLKKHHRCQSLGKV